MVEDRYNIVRRIDWIRNHLYAGQPFNSTDLMSEFDISARTAYRDIHFVRKEYFVNRLKYNIVERTYYLGLPQKSEKIVR
jgi:DeoR/GlpR family transcriptional regulator of sugar metabolism